MGSAYEEAVVVVAEPPELVAAKITPVSAANMSTPDATAAVTGDRETLSRLIIVM